MRITFLVRSIWGIGGTIKTTLNTAEALVELGHDVTIASCVRNKAKADFAIDPRIEVVSLWDVRKPEEGGERLSFLDRWRMKRPSFLDADKVNNMGESSKLLDVRVRKFLQTHQTDVLVGTQISINLYMAAYGRPAAYAMVAQEHLYLDHYTDTLRGLILEHYPKMDAIVTITDADAAAYREALPAQADKVVCVPNSIPPSSKAPSELTEPVIMTAGRLTGMKGFDILIKGFAQVADDFPEWKVKIFGRGKDRKKLKGIIDEYGLQGRVEMPGPVTPLDAEWQQASIAAIPSRFEPFGLVIVEAMAAGLPVVCSAVKHGPLEIVRTEENGILVEPKQPKQLADALRRLMSDPSLRRKLADGGLNTAKRFEPGQVVGLHVDLFDKLVKARA
ncbi:glycosyltransferase family 4 protein [Glycomyces harbinensis]|uniref:Glycosyltransferase involved in cell wall bisynthesis n=1 Tax=Glycomyces harbinensis TaxID=58114 RepID=A0A1G6V042_9ACTN|nr:glycosyltransferase family 4 protein [Glycomyces harbinensis]SDD46306.1 Glycosyltransferase involved in cell wall bisynthesis [Glycomyces harbinensis]